MIPSIEQQLKAMKRRMEESVIPELPADAKFAREQASFIVTSLAWMLDTHEHQYRYEVVENTEYRALLSAILQKKAASELAVGLVDAAKALLSEDGPSPDEAAIPLRALVMQNRRLKDLALGIYSEWSKVGGSTANPARDLLTDLSVNQGRREVAFFKRTGWVSCDDDLGALLGEVKVEPQKPSESSTLK